MPKYSSKYIRKKVIFMFFEGKNNKTEMNYFSHFVASNDEYKIIKMSSGYTDPVNMLRSAKLKRQDYDYHSSDDFTFIFCDGDNDDKKIKTIKEINHKLKSKTQIILTNPCFELWFLNHFIETNKYFTNHELSLKLMKFIPKYAKNFDIFRLIKDKRAYAVRNTLYQNSLKTGNPFCDVPVLFEKNFIIEEVDNK